MARTYATPTDLAAYMGSSAPDDASALLAKANRFIESAVFRLCWYNTDTETLLPADPVVMQAFTDAVCAQAAWWAALGDSTGADMAGWGEARIGTVMMSRSLTQTGADDSPARQVAPEVWDVLQAPDLTADRLWVGMVVS